MDAPQQLVQILSAYRRRIRHRQFLSRAGHEAGARPSAGFTGLSRRRCRSGRSGELVVLEQPLHRGTFPLFAIRTDGRPATIVGDVRRVVSEVLPRVSLAKVTTPAEQVDASIVMERLASTVAGVFGALGALLAAVVPARRAARVQPVDALRQS